MKIVLTVNGKSIAATLADTQIAGEFIAMLPLTITMYDFFGREKFGALPVGVSSKGTRSADYEVGDLVCWAPGPDLSILYRQDGQPLEGAWHFLGRIDEGIEAFGEPGALEVTIEVASEVALDGRLSDLHTFHTRHTLHTCHQDNVCTLGPAGSSCFR